MYSLKYCYEITLMHLLNIVIFAYFVKIQLAFFFIAIANDSWNHSEKQSPGPNPDNIKTAAFCQNEKVQIVLVLQC